MDGREDGEKGWDNAVLFPGSLQKGSQKLAEILAERKAAKHLIETTDDHIDQIGILVGLSDPSHFARDFKLKYGLTATDHRDKFEEKRRGDIEKGQE